MTKEYEQLSTSKVILMCGPAGAGKSTIAKELEHKGMIILSFDRESFKRNIVKHPLPDNELKNIKKYLDAKLLSLIEQNKNIVLDYSFWSRDMRLEYISLLNSKGVDPVIYYVKTPKEITMKRMNERKGTHENDIMLTEEMSSLFFDQFQPPTDDEGEIIEISGY